MFDGHNGSELRQFLQNLQVKRLDWLSVLINVSIESDVYETSYFYDRQQKAGENCVIIQSRGRVEDCRGVSGPVAL